MKNVWLSLFLVLFGGVSGVVTKQMFDRSTLVQMQGDLSEINTQLRVIAVENKRIMVNVADIQILDKRVDDIDKRVSVLENE